MRSSDPFFDYFTEFLVVPDKTFSQHFLEHEGLPEIPMTNQYVKAKASITASQLCKFVMLKLQETALKRKNFQWAQIKEGDIKLYINCRQGLKWWFEDG